MKKQPVIIDSSVTVKWLIKENELYTKEAENVLIDARDGKIIPLAPALPRYEIGNALLKKKLETPFALDSLATSYKLPIIFVTETEDLALETYQLAHSYGITYYDASFVALAKQENAILITDNPKHQAKIKEVKVVPLKDYR